MGLTLSSMDHLLPLNMMGLTLGTINHLHFEIRASPSVNFVYNGMIELYVRIEFKGLW